MCWVKQIIDVQTIGGMEHVAASAVCSIIFVRRPLATTGALGQSDAWNSRDEDHPWDVLPRGHLRGRGASRCNAGRAKKRNIFFYQRAGERQAAKAATGVSAPNTPSVFFSSCAVAAVGGINN